MKRERIGKISNPFHARIPLLEPQRRKSGTNWVHYADDNINILLRLDTLQFLIKRLQLPTLDGRITERAQQQRSDPEQLNEHAIPEYMLPLFHIVHATHAPSPITIGNIMQREVWISQRLKVLPCDRVYDINGILILQLLYILIDTGSRSRHLRIIGSCYDYYIHDYSLINSFYTTSDKHRIL